MMLVLSLEKVELAALEKVELAALGTGLLGDHFLLW